MRKNAVSATIYRGYDAKALREQYNNRGRVDLEWHQALKKTRAQRSLAVRESKIRQYHDIPFGSHRRDVRLCECDTCLPKPGTRPVTWHLLDMLPPVLIDNDWH